MINVRFFFTDPCCELSKYYAQMIPALCQKYDIEIEPICKPAAEYETDEYFELDLPMAVAVMVGGEIVAEGQKVGQYKLESVICRHLGLPAPKFDKRALYEFFRATLVWMNRRRKKWKARNVGKRAEKLRLVKTS
jgi:hypothetical protein